MVDERAEAGPPDCAFPDILVAVKVRPKWGSRIVEVPGTKSLQAYDVVERADDRIDALRCAEVPSPAKEVRRIEADAQPRMPVHRLKDVPQFLKPSTDLSSRASTILEQNHRSLRGVEGLPQRSSEAPEGITPRRIPPASDVRDGRKSVEPIHGARGVGECGNREPAQSRVCGGEVNQVGAVSHERIEVGASALFDE